MSFFAENNLVADPSKAAKTYTPVPDGTYALTIEKCEEKLSRKEDKMLSIRFTIDEGEDAGRILFENIMLSHPNQVVVEMGMRKIHALMLMTNVTAPKSADDFVGRSVTARVKVTRDKGTGELRNEVVLACETIARAATKAPAKDESKNAEAPAKSAGKAAGKVKTGGDW